MFKIDRYILCLLYYTHTYLEFLLLFYGNYNYFVIIALAYNNTSIQNVMFIQIT